MTRPSNDWIGKQIELTTDLTVGGESLQEGNIIEVTAVNPDSTLEGRVVQGEKLLKHLLFADEEILGNCRNLMRDNYVTI